MDLPVESWKEVQLQISENGVMSVTNIGVESESPAVDQLNNNVEEKRAASPARQLEVRPTTPTTETASEAHAEQSPDTPGKRAAEQEPLPPTPPPKLARPTKEEEDDKVDDDAKETKEVVKNVQQLSSNHPLKIHSQQQQRGGAGGGLQYSRVGIVPRRVSTPAPPAYKTLRDPPRAWNPQLPPRPPPPPPPSDAPPPRPAKFFKVRNMPRYLGNPASGVKPMYQLGGAGGGGGRAASHARAEPSELRINQSTVPILNPLRDKTKPERRGSPKVTTTHPANGQQPQPRDKQSQISFTPPNPFVPNLGSPTLAAPHHFLYGAGTAASASAAVVPPCPQQPYVPPHLFYHHHQQQQRYATQARAPRSTPLPPPATAPRAGSAPPDRDPKLAAA